MVPQATMGCVLCHSFARIPNLPMDTRIEEVRSRKIADSQTPIRNPAIVGYWHASPDKRVLSEHTACMHPSP
eukprot:13508634-Alexandrium_andersonii.AAC.1